MAFLEMQRAIQTSYSPQNVGNTRFVRRGLIFVLGRLEFRIYHNIWMRLETVLVQTGCGLKSVVVERSEIIVSRARLVCTGITRSEINEARYCTGIKMEMCALSLYRRKNL